MSCGIAVSQSLALSGTPPNPARAQDAYRSDHRRNGRLGTLVAIDIHVATAPTILPSSEPKKKARPPKFREASFKDHAQIAALESRYGLAAKSYEAWTHLWLG